MTTREPDTEVLLRRVEQGDAPARQGLLARHRQRLRQLVGMRLDRRLAARVDPSDVVQEALAFEQQQGARLAAVPRRPAWRTPG